MKLLGEGVLQLKTRSLNDQELNPILRNERIKRERQRAHMVALIAVPPRNYPRGALSRMRFVVELTRVSPKQLLDSHDNLPGALKHVVDGIADHLGVNDGDRTRVEWRYAQAKGPHSVRFRISEPAEPLAQNSAETAPEEPDVQP